MLNILVDNWTSKEKYIPNIVLNGEVIDDVPTLYGIEGIVANLLQIIIPIVGAVLLVVFITGGIKYITAGGEKEQTAQAKKTITSAIAGLIIVLGAWLIIRLLENFTGLNLHIFEIPRF